MSRYQIGKYSYGYDRPLAEYFLQKQFGDETKQIVGCLSPKAGTASNFLQAVQELGIPVPEDQIKQARLDLPF